DFEIGNKFEPIGIRVGRSDACPKKSVVGMWRRRRKNDLNRPRCADRPKIKSPFGWLNAVEIFARQSLVFLVDRGGYGFPGPRVERYEKYIFLVNHVLAKLHDESDRAFPLLSR